MKTDCEEFHFDLSAYVDDELSDSRRREVEKHLGACQSCEQVISSLDATTKILKAVYQDSEEPEVDMTGIWEEIEARLSFKPSPWPPSIALALSRGVS